MNPCLIVALAIAAGSFGSAWQIQSWRYDAKEKARVEQQLEDVRQSAARNIRFRDVEIDAQNQAETRARNLRVDAAGARDALVGLRTSTDAALRAAGTSKEACLIRAATLGELFEESAAEYTELAEKAGRHVNDIQKLNGSWPESP